MHRLRNWQSNVEQRVSIVSRLDRVSVAIFVVVASAWFLITFIPLLSLELAYSLLYDNDVPRNTVFGQSHALEDAVGWIMLPPTVLRFPMLMCSGGDSCGFLGPFSEDHRIAGGLVETALNSLLWASAITLLFVGVRTLARIARDIFSAGDSKHRLRNLSLLEGLGVLALVLVLMPVVSCLVISFVDRSFQRRDLRNSPHQLGDSARVDDVSWLLEDVKDESVLAGEVTSGRFLVVDFDVTNHRGNPVAIVPPLLVDGRDNEHKHLKLAESLSSRDYRCHLDEINPGVTRRCIWVYEVALQTVRDGRARLRIDSSTSRDHRWFRIGTDSADSRDWHPGYPALQSPQSQHDVP